MQFEKAEACLSSQSPEMYQPGVTHRKQRHFASNLQ